MMTRDCVVLVVLAAVMTGCTSTGEQVPVPVADRCTPVGWQRDAPQVTGDGLLRSLSVVVEDGHLHIRVTGSEDATVLVDTDQDRRSGGWSYGSVLSASAWNLRLSSEKGLEAHAGTPLDWTWRRADQRGLRVYRGSGETIACWPHDGGAVRVAAYAGDGASWLPNPFDPGVEVPPAAASQEPRTVRLPGTLAFAYQYQPWRVRDCTSVPCAAELYAGLDHVVLSAGLEQPQHRSHEQTAALVAAIAGRAEVWGYVSAVRHDGRALSERDVVQRILQWRGLGVSGVFLDDWHLTEPGWDATRIVGGGSPEPLTRGRQLRIAQAAHAAGLALFANCFSPYDALEAADGVPTPLGPGTADRPADMYLLENPSVIAGRPVTGIDLQAVTARYAAAVRLAAAAGVRLAAVDTTDAGAGADVSSGVYRLAWWRAVQAGVDAYGVSNPSYSAPDLVDLPTPAPPADAAAALAGLSFLDDAVLAPPDGRWSSRSVVGASGALARIVVEVDHDGRPLRLGVVRS